MRDTLFFLVGASIAGSIFLVSLLELLFTSRRRRAEEAVHNQVQVLKNTLTTQITQVTEESKTKLGDAEKMVDSLKTQVTAERTQLEEKYSKELSEVKAQAAHALEQTKAKAKRLEQQAKLQADEYLATRTREVEEDLMNLVLDVTKRVLPPGLTYEVQRDLVLEALREVKHHHA